MRKSNRPPSRFSGIQLPSHRDKSKGSRVAGKTSDRLSLRKKVPWVGHWSFVFTGILTRGLWILFPLTKEFNKALIFLQEQPDYWELSHWRGHHGRAGHLCGGHVRVATRWRSRHGCQISIAAFLNTMCLALRASGLWLRYAVLQNLIPSFPWIAPEWMAGSQDSK